MIQRTAPTAEDDIHPKWLNSPVRFFEGSLSEIRRHIPTFERRSFGLTQPSDGSLRLNKHLDTVIRLPFGEDGALIPVGVVSKNYALVQHDEVLNVVTQELETARIPLASVKAGLTITEYGERMALSLHLPDKYSFDPGDGHPMALRLECLNSVDGSTRFRALMGWFRFVCSNGLVFGVTRSDVRRRHVGDLRPEDVRAVLKAGLEDHETEKKNFERWYKTEIKPNRLSPWADTELREGWGFKAAARAFHIASHGRDAEVIGSYKDSTPTTIAMQETKPVPGSPRYCRNLFDLSQVLAWLAKERRDVQEQLEWREKIPDLMAPLMN